MIPGYIFQAWGCVCFMLHCLFGLQVIVELCERGEYNSTSFCTTCLVSHVLQSLSVFCHFLLAWSVVIEYVLVVM